MKEKDKRVRRNQQEHGNISRDKIINPTKPRIVYKNPGEWTNLVERNMTNVVWTCFYNKTNADVSYHVWLTDVK